MVSRSAVRSVMVAPRSVAWGREPGARGPAQGRQTPAARSEYSDWGAGGAGKDSGSAVR